MATFLAIPRSLTDLFTWNDLESTFNSKTISNIVERYSHAVMVTWLLCGYRCIIKHKSQLLLHVTLINMLYGYFHPSCTLSMLYSKIERVCTPQFMCIARQNHQGRRKIDHWQGGGLNISFENNALKTKDFKIT